LTRLDESNSSVGVGNNRLFERTSTVNKRSSGENRRERRREKGERERERDREVREKKGRRNRRSE
jgi:hypothetical protein